MSSSDRLNPQQLALFIPAGELKANVYPSDDWVDRKQMWADKLTETKTSAYPYGVHDTPSHGAGLHESIQSQGVQAPVELLPAESRGKPVNILFDGHHRVAAAADIDPKMEVPVKYVSMFGAREAGRVK